MWSRVQPWVSGRKAVGRGLWGRGLWGGACGGGALWAWAGPVVGLGLLGVGKMH